MANYMYQPAYNPVPYGYPPVMSRIDYGYPVGYNIPPPSDMIDNGMDVNSGYNGGAYSSAYPYPYPMYYNVPSPRKHFNINNNPQAYRAQDMRHHREDNDELNDKRSAGQDRMRNANKVPKRSEDTSPSDLNPDSLKNMLYDTLQQEMSALEVLKQQIASFTLLTHTLEEKSQNDRLGRSTTTSEPETTNRAQNQPQMNMPMPTPSEETPPKTVPSLQQTNYVPQFDSQAGQGGGLYSMPAQNMKSPLTSMNFISQNSPPYYTYKFPAAMSETIAQPTPVHQYSPYAYNNNHMTMTPSPTPQMGNQADPNGGQSSFFNMNHSGTAAPNVANPGSIPAVGVNGPYAPMPMDPINLGNSYPSNINYQPQLPIYSYANSVRYMPAEQVFNRRSNVVDSYTPPDSFHDLAIRTLYDVEDKLKEAEEQISEKITEFESEVSAQTLSRSMPSAIPMAYESYPAYNNFSGGRRSMDQRGKSADMNPTMVKELAVRALQAIDRRLRAAEKTIDKTINNFEGMDGAARAVKSSTREMGVQTAKRERAYDSDTDDTNRYRNSDS